MTGDGKVTIFQTEIKQLHDHPESEDGDQSTDLDVAVMWILPDVVEEPGLTKGRTMFPRVHR